MDEPHMLVRGQGMGMPGSWRGLAGGPGLSPSPLLVLGPPTAASTRQQLLSYEILAKAHRLGQLLAWPPLCFQPRGAAGREQEARQGAQSPERGGGAASPGRPRPAADVMPRWRSGGTCLAARAARCLVWLGFPPLSHLLGTPASCCATTQPWVSLQSLQGGQLGSLGCPVLPLPCKPRQEPVRLTAGCTRCKGKTVNAFALGLLT